MTVAHPIDSAMPDASGRLASLTLVLSGLAFIAAFWTLTMSQATHALWVGTFLASMVGFGGLLAMVMDRSFSTPWSVYAVSLSLGYGFGSFNSLMRGYDHGTSWLAVTFASQASVAMALGGVMLLTAGLLIVGRIDTHKLLPRLEISPLDRKVALILMLLVTFAGVVAFAAGRIGFQGGMGSEEGSARVSALGAVLSASLAGVLGMSGYVFAREQRRGIRWLVIAAAVLIGVMLFIQGRRIFMYGVLVGLIGFLGARGLKGLLTLRTLVGLVVMVACFFGASRAYMAMRISGYTLGPNPTLSERWNGAVDILKNAERTGLMEATAENEATRTFILGYLGELVEKLQTRPPMWGELLEFNLASSVPTVIWPGKWRIMAEVGTEEYACNAHLAMPFWDGANSLISAGLCDFLWPGVVLYVGLTLGLFALFNRLLAGMPPVVRLLACFATMENLLQVEGSMTSSFVLIRNISVLLLIAWSVQWLVQWHESRPWTRHRAMVKTQNQAGESQ